MLQRLHEVSHSFDRLRFYTRKILCPRYFSPVAFNRRKVTRHVTPDFDICEVYLDMQMSFLNAAPLVYDLQLQFHLTPL